jgi:hypothetical protein
VISSPAASRISSLPPVFIGCGFAAKYPMGGGNFSVPLQYLLELQRLKRHGIWLEVLPESGDPVLDASRITIFERRMRYYQLDYCLLLEPKALQQKNQRSTILSR